MVAVHLFAHDALRLEQPNQIAFKCRRSARTDFSGYGGAERG